MYFAVYEVYVSIVLTQGATVLLFVVRGWRMTAFENLVTLSHNMKSLFVPCTFLRSAILLADPSLFPPPSNRSNFSLATAFGFTSLIYQFLVFVGFKRFFLTPTKVDYRKHPDVQKQKRIGISHTTLDSSFSENDLDLQTSGLFTGRLKPSGSGRVGSGEGDPTRPVRV